VQGSAASWADVAWLALGLVVSVTQLLTDEQLANCPVLILGNKIDRPGAAGEDEIRSYFGLHGQTTGKVCQTDGMTD